VQKPLVGLHSKVDAERHPQGLKRSVECLEKVIREKDTERKAIINTNWGNNKK